MGILTQLGIDQSFFYQFGVFIVVFFALKVVLFNKLLTVIEIREEKTTKLVDNAEGKSQEAEKLAAQYEETINTTHQEVMAKASVAKEAFKKAESSRMKEGEEKVSQDYAQKRAQAESEVQSSKDAILSQSNQLANDLVSRLTQ